MKERQLIKQIKEYLGNEGVEVYKYFGSVYGIKGFPDLFGFIPGNPAGIFFIECKVAPNKPTILQTNFLKRVKQKGAIAFVAYSLNDVKQNLDQYMYLSQLYKC